MAKFFGIGRSFKKGIGGIPARVEDQELIRDSVFQILETGVGERVMRPNFGGRLNNLAFETQGPVLNALVKREVVALLTRFEPRVKVLEVIPTEEDTKLTIDVIYEALGVVDKVTVQVGE